SNVYAVGNLPFTVDEATMVEIFESVGPVIGFRIAVDSYTGRSIGYGFCDFYADHEAAEQAIRDLDGLRVHGHLLRVARCHLRVSASDVATAAQNRRLTADLAGRATIPAVEPLARESRLLKDEPMTEMACNIDVGGSYGGAGFLGCVPPGIPLAVGERSADVIASRMATMTECMSGELLTEVKGFVSAHPYEARQLFQYHPQLTYAVVMGLILHRVCLP
ncbi:hypothetical protein B0H16DRAFT_1215414, partial [Mycena metata]